VLTTYVATPKIAELVGLPEDLHHATPHYILGGSAVLAFHRWMEVLSDKIPASAHLSFRHWCVWLCAPVCEVRFDRQGAAVPPAPGFLLRRAGTVAKDLALLVLATSTYPLLERAPSPVRQFWLAVYFSSFMSALSQGRARPPPAAQRAVHGLPAAAIERSSRARPRARDEPPRV
jgi:hypothetical protein